MVEDVGLDCLVLRPALFREKHVDLDGQTLRRGVELAIELGKGDARPLTKDASLGALLAADKSDVDLLVGLRAQEIGIPQIVGSADKFGIEVVTLTFDQQRRVSLRLTGDAAKLEMGRGMLIGAMDIPSIDAGAPLSG